MICLGPEVRPTSTPFPYPFSKVFATFAYFQLSGASLGLHELYKGNEVVNIRTQENYKHLNKKISWGKKKKKDFHLIQIGITGNK